VKCIVGLGNPGSRYRFTRHNIGFLALELMIASFKASHAESNDLFECYQTSIGETPVLFLMPQTYMNNSGVAIREIRQQYDLALEDILVLFDDFQLPFGTLRLRPKGSDGGHNGIASVIYHLQSDLIPRLRIGVGGATLPASHTHEVMADYVLSSFDAEEKELLPRLLHHTQDACVGWIEAGIQKTMSQYNRNFFSSAGAE
jgi:PTH1 family peptidyl-tRNA hydrolase